MHLLIMTLGEIYEHIPDSERYWIEQGSHLGFYLSPHADIAQKTARDFLEKHRP